MARFFPLLVAPGFFISEYIEGSSNNKAIEIYNGTGAAINLATGGYSVQMFFNVFQDQAKVPRIDRAECRW